MKLAEEKKEQRGDCLERNQVDQFMERTKKRTGSIPTPDVKSFRSFRDFLTSHCS